MSSEMKNRIPPFAEGVFILPPHDEKSPALVGGFCPDCRDYFFPTPGYCPACLKPVIPQSVGSKGRIYSFTIVRTPPPFGLPEPYGVGYVDLAETGLRVFGLFDPGDIADLKINAAVTLSVKPLGHDGKGSPRLRPFFTLQKEQQTGI